MAGAVLDQIFGCGGHRDSWAIEQVLPTVVVIDRLTDQQFAPRRRHALEPYAVLWLVQA